MKLIIKSLFGGLARLWGCLYSFETSSWLLQKRNSLYTMWIRNFIGEVGTGTRFMRPMRLEGGGYRKIHIGTNTVFNSLDLDAGLACGNILTMATSLFYPQIIIGNDCNFGEFCQITAINRISIGNGLLTGRFVYIGDNAHGGLSSEEKDIPPIKRKLQSKGEIVIGNNVWIGDKVTILGGVTIGDNVIIGAGSIVTHNIPSDCVAVGIPVKVVRIMSPSSEEDFAEIEKTQEIP